MSLSGHLEEISFTDVVDSLRKNHRSGVLRLARGADRARVAFKQGQPISARAPGLARLGDALVASGLADPITVREAARIQAEERGRRPLGQILLANGVLTEESLERILTQQIGAAFRELTSWEHGHFEFIGEEPRIQDPIYLDPSKLAPPNLDPIDFETEPPAGREGASVDDDASTWEVPHPSSNGEPAERGGPGREARGAEEEGREADGGETTRHSPERWLLEVVSPDLALFELLHELTPVELARPIRIAPQQIAQRPGGRRSRAFVLLDLRRDQVAPDDIRQLAEQRRGVPILAVVDARPDIRRAYEAGAAAVVPPEPEVIIASLRNLSSLVAELAAPALETPLSSALAIGPAAVGEMNPPSLSGTVALELMRAVSESTERAVLFLVGQEGLGVAGAFGSGADDRPLAELTRGLWLELAHGGSLTESVHDSRALYLDFNAVEVPEPLRKLLGPPITGQGVALPIHGRGGAVAVIYADNDQIDREIEDLEILELTARQVGPHLEAEILSSYARASY